MTDIAETHGTAYHESPKLLWELLCETLQVSGDSPAIVCLHQRPVLQEDKQYSDHLVWSYQKLADNATILASRVVADGHNLRHASIACFVPNGFEWSLLYWTAAKLNMPIAALDPKIIEGRDLSGQDHYLATVRPRIIMANSNVAALSIDNACERLDLKPSLKLLTQAVEFPQPQGWISLAHYIEESPPVDPIQVLSMPEAANPDDIARILFTGGSTGLPKGCPHSSSNLTTESSGCESMRGLTDRSRTLIQSPVHHIMANAAALLTWRAGGTVIFPAARFDPASSLRAIEQYQCTYLAVHHSMTDALLRHPTFSTSKVKSVESIQIGGALIGLDLVQKYDQAFGGVEIFPFWGSTEGMYTTACVKGAALSTREGILSVGKAYVGGRVKIADPETSLTMKRGEIGELHYGGASVIQQYCDGRSPESFYADNKGITWFKTGDQGVMSSDGSIFMLGRYKDMIKRGGENVFPQLIEHKLLSEMKIKTVIIGIPDEVMGETCVAIVDDRSSQGFSSKAKLQRQMVDDFGAEFVFSHVFTLSDLGLDAYPLNPGGKVLKIKVRDLALKHLQNASDHAAGSTLNLVKSIWSRFLHTDPTELDDTADMRDFMDSLIGIRFCFEIEKYTSKQLVLADLQNALTIRDQAALVDAASAGELAKTLIDLPSRPGPPEVDDIAYLSGDIEALTKLKEAAKPTLHEHGLNWHDDIEDVYAFQSFWATLFHRPAIKCGNLRFTFEIKDYSYEQISTAVLKAMESRPCVRTLGLVTDKGSIALQIRPSKKFWDGAVLRGPSFTDIESAVETACHEPEFAPIHLPNRLFVCKISPIPSKNSHLLCVSLSHCVGDAMINNPFFADISRFLADPAAPHLVDYTSFKLYEDMYFQLQESTVAREGARLIAETLRGIGAPQHIGGFWPKSSADDLPPEILASSRGHRSVRVSRQIPSLTHLKSQGIHPATALKLAVAMAVMKTVNSVSAAMFGCEAGRFWPFQPEWVQRRLPNPMAISGPTLEGVAVYIDAREGETIIQLCQRLQESSRILATHMHSPFMHMRSLLSEEDQKGLDACLSSMLFNVVPDIADFSGLSNDNHPLLEWRDCSFLASMTVAFQAGFLGDDKCVVMGLYEELLISREELVRFIESAMDFLEIVIKEENWNRVVRNVVKS